MFNIEEEKAKLLEEKKVFEETNDRLQKVIADATTSIYWNKKRIKLITQQIEIFNGQKGVAE